MPTKKNTSVLAQFSETITRRYGEAKEIVLDTGPENGKYRVVAKLKKKGCPECQAIHYSKLSGNTCLGCECILGEEKRLGRKMTQQERTEFLSKVGF